MGVEILTVTSAADDLTEIARDKLVHPAARICRAHISDTFFLGRWNSRAAGDSRKRVTKGSKKATEFEVQQPATRSTRNTNGMKIVLLRPCTPLTGAAAHAKSEGCSRRTIHLTANGRQ